MDAKEYLEEGARHFLPNLSVDLVIIGYREGELKCLLLRVGKKWLLPGGHIGRDESVEAAADRILKERTAIEHPHLRFISVFGSEDRKFTEEMGEAFREVGLPWREDYWINDRFVTLGYYSLVDIEQTRPKVGHFDDEFGWFSYEELPEMWLDHRDIVLEARERLREDIQHFQVSYKLLPGEFTMPELHQLQEVILGEKVDRSRFQKKMLSTGAFERLPKKRKSSPGRNPYQYRVKLEVFPNKK